MEFGRLLHYHRAIREASQETRTQEHVLAHNESFEPLDLFDLWHDHVTEFPGLLDKIAVAMTDGPTLQELEKASNSGNRPRNDAFVFWLAGEMINAGIEVVAVDRIRRMGWSGHASGDITVRCNGVIVDVQCKRPRSVRALSKNLAIARKQILDAAPVIAGGIIAVDCSVIIRPPGMVHETQSPEAGLQFYSKRLERIVTTLPAQGEPLVLGIHAVARAPVMVVRASPILMRSGKPYLSATRPESVLTSCIVANRQAANPSLLLKITKQLQDALRP